MTLTQTSQLNGLGATFSHSGRNWARRPPTLPRLPWLRRPDPRGKESSGSKDAWGERWVVIITWRCCPFLAFDFLDLDEEP